MKVAKKSKCFKGIGKKTESKEEKNNKKGGNTNKRNTDVEGEILQAKRYAGAMRLRGSAANKQVNNGVSSFVACRQGLSSASLSGASLNGAKRKRVLVALCVLLALVGVLTINIAQSAWANGGAGTTSVLKKVQQEDSENAHAVFETDSFSVQDKLAEQVDVTGKSYGKDPGWFEGIFSTFNDAQLTDIKQRIRTKATLVDAEKYKAGQSIDELMNNKEDALDSFISQIEYKSSIYDFGDADYYAAKLNILQENGFCQQGMSDIVFARDNYNGEEVKDVIFNKEKGIAYIPKEIVDSYKPTNEHAEQGNVLQAQMLCPVNANIASATNLVKAKLLNTKTGTTQESEIAGDVFSNQSYIQLVSATSAKEIDPQSINIDINNGATVIAGSSTTEKENAEDIKSDTCGAYYNTETGILGINMPVAAISNLNISYAVQQSAFSALSQNKITPSALPSEMNCVDGATFAALDLKKLREYCYSSGNFYFGTACYVGAGGANDFPGRNTDQVYYPTPLDGSGYITQSSWDNATHESQYEQIGDRYPAGAVAGLRIGYNMTVLLPEGAGHSIGVYDKNSMRAACERGDAVNGLWTTAEDPNNPIIKDYAWHFAEPKPSTRMFSAICSHVNNPYSWEADDGVCTAYTKIIDINVEQSTITMAFLANLGGNNGGQTCSQVAKFRATPAKGYIELWKKSCDESVTSGNNNYSLANAEYVVYKDEACSQEATRLYTNEDGWAKSGELDAGFYWVREANASAGYKVDVETHGVNVASGQTGYVNSFEKEKRGHIKIFKSSKNDDISKNNRCYSLKDAVYGVYSDEKCSSKVTQIKTDAEGKGSATNLPLNTYWVKESVPPKGFALDTKTYKVQINDEAVYEVKSGETPRNTTVSLLIKKHDSDFKEGVPQGDATLAGAKFSVSYYDGYYNSSNLPENAMRAWVFQTDEEGKVQLDEAHKVSGPELYYSISKQPCLPLGTVVIQETDPPEGYKLGDNKPYLQQIKDTNAKAEDEDVKVFKSPTFENPVIRGGVEVYKKDNELNVSAALAGQGHVSAKTHPSLNDITFEIKNVSKHSVYVEEQTYAPEHVVKTITTAWDEERQAYRAATSTDCLPYGTYTITEVATNDSYLLSDGAPREFKISKNGEFASYDNAFINQVVRNDLRLQKKADDTSQALSYVPFALTHTGTGETHILVTDENGYIDTANGIAKHSDATNSFDALLTQEANNLNLTAVKDCISEGKVLEKSAIEACGKAGATGVWFGQGENGEMAEVDNTLPALPYGEYLLYELPCEANKNLKLFSTQLRIYADVSVFARGYDLGTVLNYSTPQPPEISTSATDKADADKYVSADKEACIVDSVSYKNLEMGTTYRLEGTLMDKETGQVLADAENKPITASLEFSAPVTNGTIDVTYNFDSSLLAGHELVVYEKLYCGEELLISHEDINDTSQTVRILSLETSARNGDVTGKDDSENRVVPAGEVHIVDTLVYKGLEAGKTYKVYGMLMNKETGKSLKTQEGNVVDAKTEFVAEKSSGQTEVEFSADTSDVVGKELVVYEQIFDSNGNEVLRHEDLANKQQTVSVEMSTNPPAEENPPEETTPSTPEITPAVAQVQQSEKSEQTPKTGDNIQQKILVLVALALVALLILRVALYRRLKERERLKQGESFR